MTCRELVNPIGKVPPARKCKPGKVRTRVSGLFEQLGSCVSAAAPDNFFKKKKGKWDRDRQKIVGASKMHQFRQPNANISQHLVLVMLKKTGHCLET